MGLGTLTNVCSSHRGSSSLFIPKSPFTFQQLMPLKDTYVLEKHNFLTICRIDIGPIRIKACTLANQNDLKIKGQGYLTVFVLMNLISRMLKVIYRKKFLDEVLSQDILKYCNSAPPPTTQIKLQSLLPLLSKMLVMAPLYNNCQRQRLEAFLKRIFQSIHPKTIQCHL